MTGRKNDAGKHRWDLVPWGQMRDVAAVLTLGAAEYGDDNWQRVEGGRKRYLAALFRHVVAWATGERDDPETGLSHLAHAATNCLFLMHLDAIDQPVPFEMTAEAYAENQKRSVQEHVIASVRSLERANEVTRRANEAGDGNRAALALQWLQSQGYSVHQSDVSTRWVASRSDGPEASAATVPELAAYLGWPG